MRPCRDLAEIENAGQGLAPRFATGPESQRKSLFLGGATAWKLQRCWLSISGAPMSVSQKEVPVLAIAGAHPQLYNHDLAPVAPAGRTWGSFSLFAMWMSDVHSVG